MPILKSAIKKVRKDKIRTARNLKREEALKKVIKKVRKGKTVASLREAFSALDKAAKVKLIHKNKANRLKSRLSKLVSPQPTKTTKSRVVKKTS